MQNKFKKVSASQIKAINELLQQQAALGNSLGVNVIQSNRYMRDCAVGKLVGVDLMNTDQHGWDGVFKYGTFFENKNVKAECKSGISFALKFQDTSLEKLQVLKDGVICTTTFWDKNGKPAFIMVGNTSAVGDYLEESYRPESRKSSTVSMSRCLNRGFKLVAGSYTKEQVVDTVTEKFPRMAQFITTDTVYNLKDIKSLVGEMMA